MSLLVHNLALGLDESMDALHERTARKLRITPEQIRALHIARRSLDARRGRMQWVYSVVVQTTGDPKRILSRCRGRGVERFHAPTGPTVEPGTESMSAPPVVVGAGPAGLFAALLLAEAGYKPVVLDRGRDVKPRHEDIRRFIEQRELNGESNFLFGEGGAGAYSDGKLYTRISDPLGAWVVEQFVAFGADPDIAIDGKPHVGSDVLPEVCRRMHYRIEQLGGRFRYDARVDDVELAGGRVRSLVLGDGQRVPASAVLLGIGHSARDTYEMLRRRGVSLSGKPFQMGLRIEHPQSLIDAAQYGPHAGRADLGAADYHLVARGAAGDRDVYTFCMCPGGRVLPVGHEPETICTNGGSVQRRDSGWANAGVVTTVTPEHADTDPLAGMRMQREVEHACFLAAGGDYALAGQTVEDFLAHRATEAVPECSSLVPVRGVDFNELLPGDIVRAIHNALGQFDQRIAGFAGPQAVLLGPETRASSPVRINRDRDSRLSPSADNLYPIGEGAGYAGGIVSAAVDGLRSAERIIARFAPAR